jgi:uncharacterized protein YndB with AHSA1/START domain
LQRTHRQAGSCNLFNRTVNTLVFAEDGDRTLMTLTVLYPSKEARDAAMANGMTSGMTESFDRLDAFLRSH